MHQPFVFPQGLGTGGLGTSLRRVGVATRTAQTIGLEYAERSSDEVTATLHKLAAAESPGETFAIQGAFLRGAGERFTARSAVFSDLFATLTADLARPRAAFGPSRAT